MSPLVEATLEDPMTIFRAAIKSPTTRAYYERRLAVFLTRVGTTSPPTFLQKARESPKWAETQVLGYLMDLRARVEAGKLSAATLPNYLKPVRLFLEMNDVSLNWKKLTRTYPKARVVADDRAPTLEEVRNLASDSDYRVKFAVLALASGGFRVGAWDGMKMKHIVPIVKDGALVTARVTVYAGTPDQYFTFISPEACQVLEAYKKHREDNGEKIGPDSPVLRNLFQKGKAHRPRPLEASGLRSLLVGRLWKLGMRTEKRTRHDFQAVHGFRKFFKTRAEQAMRPLHVEILMGHATGLTDNYYRPTEDQLVEDYLKAVPYLTILEPAMLPEAVEEVKDLRERVKALEAERARARPDVATLVLVGEAVLQMMEENPKLKEALRVRLAA